MYEHLTEEERQAGAPELRRLLNEARAEVAQYKRESRLLGGVGSRLTNLLDAARSGTPPGERPDGIDWLKAHWVEWMITEPLARFEMCWGQREWGDFETDVRSIEEMRERMKVRSDREMARRGG